LSVGVGELVTSCFNHLNIMWKKWAQWEQ